VQARNEDCTNASVEAIKLAPDSPNAPEVRKVLDECRETLGKPALRAELAPGQGALSVMANVEGAQVTVRELPLREHIDVPVREQLIVELYSK